MRKTYKKINARIFEILKFFGDNLKKKREVTHWFYFDDLTDLEQFEKYAFDIGFQTMTKDLYVRKGFDQLLLIMVVKESMQKTKIDFDTMDFLEKAEEFNGTYDGWETAIEMK